MVDDRTIRLEDWVASRAPSGDLLLQMDIEGGEWAVLLDASPEVLRRFRVVVMEIHGLDRLLDEHGFSTISTALDRLLGDFHLVHAHPNNYARYVLRGDTIIPPVLEVTFLRKDRADATGYATHFPHPLDRAEHALDVCAAAAGAMAPVARRELQDVSLSQTSFGTMQQIDQLRLPEPRPGVGAMPARFRAGRNQHVARARHPPRRRLGDASSW